MAKKPVIKDRRLALWGGIGAILIGSAMLYDAYENRDVKRPFFTKLLPGG
jgi:hypothetical protein